MQKSESKQLVGSQTWKGPPRLVVLNYVKQSPSLMAQWIKLPFQGENFQCFCKDGIHHFTNCSSDWLWPLWSVPGNTSLLRDAFIPQLARLGSITKPPFSIQLLTDSLSLSVALFGCPPQALPLPQSHRRLGRKPQLSCSIRHHQDAAAAAPRSQTWVTVRKWDWASFMPILTLGNFPASRGFWLNHWS